MEATGCPAGRKSAFKGVLVKRSRLALQRVSDMLFHLHKCKYSYDSQQCSSYNLSTLSLKAVTSLNIKHTVHDPVRHDVFNLNVA